MKTVYLFLLGSLALFACNENDTNSEQAHSDSIKHEAGMASLVDSANYTSLEWLDSTTQDLGKLKMGQSVEVSWRLKNTGTKPLVVANVIAGCGCTVAEKPEEPIMPGAVSVIKATFNSQGQREGEHTKGVTVQANTAEPHHPLQFRVEVIK